MRVQLGRRGRLVAVLTVGLLAVGAGLASADIPDGGTGGLVHLCYQVNKAGNLDKGGLRLIDPNGTGTAFSKSCRAGKELALDIDSGGPITSADIENGTIGAADINQNQVQRRLSASCGSQGITDIAANGTPTCTNPMVSAIVDGANAQIVSGFGSGFTVNRGSASVYHLIWPNGTFSYLVAPLAQPILNSAPAPTLTITGVFEGINPVGPGGLELDIETGAVDTYFSVVLVPIGGP